MPSFLANTKQHGSPLELSDFYTAWLVSVQSLKYIDILLTGLTMSKKAAIVQVKALVTRKSEELLLYYFH